MAVEQALMTVEEFWAQYAGKPYELIDGHVVPIASGLISGEAEVTLPTGSDHAAVEHLISLHFGKFLEEHDLGTLYVGEAGFQLGPDKLVGADVAFVRKAKLAGIPDPRKFLPFAPDIAMEIVSPNDRASSIQHKVSLYLEAGTALVLVIYPELRQITVFRSDGPSATLSKDQVLEIGDVLPGFRIEVKELFPNE